MADPIVIPDSVILSTPEPKAAPEPKTEAAAPAAPTAAEVRKMKLKIDGQEGEYDEAEVIKWAQQGKSAAKRYQEAADMKKQAEGFIARLKDPGQLAEILKDPAIGLDVKKWAEEYVWQQLQEESLTPEQKRQRDIDAELKKYRDAEAKSKADAEAKADKELQDHYEVDFEKKILSALEIGGLPTKGKAGREVVRRMSQYMLTAAQNNLDIEPADLVKQVRKDLNEEHRAMYDDAPDDLLDELLGSVGKRLREADVKKLKTTQQQAFSKPNKAASATDNKPKKLSGADWREALKRDFLK